MSDFGELLQAAEQLTAEFDPASAKAIAHARPRPFPAPVTKEYLPFKLYFFKYIFIKLI